MRMHILNATMQCLINIGYTQTTTEKIAKQAGVSRGAMTHHFKSRAEVFAAASEHITDIRVMEYDAAISEVSRRAMGEPTQESMLETLQVLQEYFMKPSFLAFHELVRGARTDPELHAVMDPLERSLDERISKSIEAHFPVWAEVGMKETGEVLRDLIMHALRGVALDPSGYLLGDRLHRLHQMLAKMAMTEYHEAYKCKEQLLSAN
ncbi:TetR/AcrR family transcriptional regulator [Pseudomonas sp. MOB-449]|nr:TetR/AcrR family transcriptional regulator [Pseudomonas sp. MOB-449]